MNITATRRTVGIGIASLALMGGSASGVAMASTGGGAAPAGVEAKGASDCPKGWLCVWSGKNFTGRMQKVQYNNKDLSRFAVFAGGSWSGYNNGRKCDVALYAGKNYTKYIGTQPRGEKGNANHKLKILSNKWVNCR
ncbi:peptidase inhibitor family I36 protein [Streptomyces sp. NBC_01381]|uniref:peptidase inhibitor family I36 protein n=1 Tax=unclassified Streptomyces TaxID=2593676 RepID=UPI0022572589|nr:peptidase inhibitor family I36 protein [Streptomyces sp. NBC_01381]MCX4669367.1 peptidase inhibitor family I36 protein [Streptomyces sp. NBC_01381]